MTICSICHKTFYLHSNDDEPRHIDGNPVCNDCYYEKLGECIEKHPIGIPIHVYNR